MIMFGGGQAVTYDLLRMQHRGAFNERKLPLGGYCKFVLINSVILFVIGYLIDTFRQFFFARIKKWYKASKCKPTGQDGALDERGIQS